MFLQFFWFIMMAGSLLYGGVLSGMEAGAMQAMLSGCENAIALTIKLGAGYLLFCGLMEVARAVGAPQALERAIRPLMRRMMPHVQQESTREAIAMNLSMNLLGAGNAATPLGIEAVRRMDAECARCPQARHDIYMLLILNATSIQLLPTTVLTLRAAAGSAQINAVVLPTLLCTAVSTLAGAGTALLCRKWRRKQHER